MTGGAIDSDVRTTAGAIALGNLQAQIDGLEHEAAGGRLDVAAKAGLIDLISLRGHVLGRIADHESASVLAERLVDDAPAAGDALVARARTRATFHHFDDALTDLEGAERLGAAPASVATERAVILQAIGRSDEALAICLAVVERRADYRAVGALATVYAERGDVANAEAAFTESRVRYRSVSPIPLVQLDVRRARMWIEAQDLARARPWLEDGVRRLPRYAPGIGHLAEVEAGMGETEAAIGRLVPLTRESDDPHHAGQLARILRDAGRSREAGLWRARAAARYEELVERHPAAFADHAAEFWLSGGDPGRALTLAATNLELRPTTRARELLARAQRAVHAAGTPSTTETRPCAVA